MLQNSWWRSSPPDCRSTRHRKMIKQEKPVSLDRGSLMGTGRELVLHERSRKKRESVREAHSDNFIRNLSKPHPDVTGRSHCTARRNLNEYFEKDFTFSPKLNEQSIKLAKERTARLITGDDDNKEFTRNTELQKLYTFKPAVSPASVRIVQNLGTTFLTRQQLHIERKQKLLEEARRIPVPLLHRPKKNSKLLLSSEASSDNAYKSFANTESVTDETERLHLPPCPSTPTLTQQNSAEEMTPQTPLPHNTMTDPSDMEKNHQTAKISNSLVFSPVIQSHSSNKSLTKSTTISQASIKLQADQKKSPVCRQKYPSHNSDQEIYRFKRLKVKAENVMRSKKVFVVQGPYRSVRSSMRKRGWVEQSYRRPLGDQDGIITKLPIKKTAKPKADKAKSAVDSSSDDSDDSSSSDDDDLDSESEHSDEEDYCLMSRAVRNSLPFFIWTCRRDDLLCRNLRKDQIVNHFDKAASLTTKVGLCTNLQNLPWFGDVDPNTFFPRCYRLCNQEEKHAFIDDYRLTAAISLLKILISRLTSDKSCSIPSRCSSPHCSTPAHPRSRHQPSRHSTPTHGRRKIVPELAFNLAIQACEYFVGFEEHNDIDSDTSLCPPLNNSQWDVLVNHHYDAISENYQLVCSSSVAAKAKILLVQTGCQVTPPSVRGNQPSSQVMLSDQLEGLNLIAVTWNQGPDPALKQHLPQLSMDGMRNIWILKPGAKSRGRGISCMDQLDNILAVVSNPVQMRESKWIIQKYIETPLLIYDTKFDIRQWFLVTDWNPLTMWMYKDCYLRFCTQQFSLDDLDISIHLANNCIQKNYSNSPTRCNLLPSENMWDSEQFKKYLSSIGASPTHWDTVIYAGMREALINALQVTQDDIDYQRNAFELYGADFMITTDLKPWLIEINCSPTMSYSTSVTKRLCKAVLEDTIKVVVDRKLDKNCDIGNFELAYKQQKMGIPSYVGVQLCVEGCAIRRMAGVGGCSGNGGGHNNSNRSAKSEWTRAQTPKLSRQELTLKGTKFEQKIKISG